MSINHKDIYKNNFLIISSNFGFSKKGEWKKIYLQEFLKFDLGRKLDSLPVLTKAENEKIINDISALTSELSIKNKNNNSWWYAPPSNRDVFINPFIRKYQIYKRIEKFFKIKKEDGNKVIFFTKDKKLADLVFKLAKKNFWTVIFDWKTKILLQSMNLVSFLSSLFNIFKWLISNLVVVFKTNLFIKKKINFKDFDVIFFTAFEKPFEEKIPHPYKDLYFGKCPYEIEQSGKKTLVIGRCSGEPLRVIPKLRKVNSPTVIAHHDLVNLGMVLSTFMKSFFQKINFSIEGLDRQILLSFLKKDSLEWVLTMADCLLYENAISKLFKVNQSATVVHLYENNIWERSIDITSRKISPKRRLLGYLHTSILPLHMKNIISLDEIPIRPAPDKIITTHITPIRK